MRLTITSLISRLLYPAFQLLFFVHYVTKKAEKEPRNQ